MRLDGKRVLITGHTVDPVAAADWVDGAADALAGIDVLYNNAAGFGFNPFAKGIRANVISPGFVASPATDAAGFR